jgi:hypothetical protein
VQDASKQTVRAVFIFPSKSCIEIIDPNMCKLNGMIDAFETYRAHDSLQGKQES